MSHSRPVWVLKQTSERQRISVMRHPRLGLILSLDDAVQFTEYDEHRYHECLAVVPSLFCRPRTVFIAGGGDGLAAARLLRMDGIEHIVLCDWDPAITDLCRTRPELVALNGGSLSDPRVQVVNEDAVSYLENVDIAYDLIICDFPDALTEELSRLYTRATYSVIARRLAANGVVCVQTAMLPPARALIVNTIRAVFPHTLFYRTHLLSGGRAGFTMASREPFQRLHPCPSWTRHLDDRVVDTLFVIPSDERVESDEINTDESRQLARVMLLGIYRNTVSSPYPYNPEYRVVTIDAENPCVAYLLPALLRYLDEICPLVVYLDRGHRPRYEDQLERLGYRCTRSYRRMTYRFSASNTQRLDQVWARIDNGSITDVEAYHGRTDRYPEVAALMDEYLRHYGDRFLDAPRCADVLSRERLHLLARDRSGRPMVLMVVLVEDHLTVDILYGRGCPRVNMLGLMACIRYIGREYGTPTLFESATANDAGVMTKLGADTDGWYDVFVPDPRGSRTSTSTHPGATS